MGIALSEHVVAELKRELVRLEKQRAEIDGHIKSISALLQPTQSELELSGPRPLVDSGHEEIEEIGLREAIRRVLSTKPTGMRPRDVVRGLETTGFKPRPGRTTLETRVYNELWRMAKRDGVRKRGGKYALEEKHESGPR